MVLHAPLRIVNTHILPYVPLCLPRFSYETANILLRALASLGKVAQKVLAVPLHTLVLAVMGPRSSCSLFPNSMNLQHQQCQVIGCTFSHYAANASWSASKQRASSSIIGDLTRKSTVNPTQG